MNNKVLITEREFEMINVLANVHAANQRELSTKAGMSLGMTNVVLKRLAKKGMLKIRQLNRKKVDYLLTARGFTEKARKSCRYVIKTLNSLAFLKENIKKVIAVHQSEGFQHFALSGKGDTQDLIELASRDLLSTGVKLARISEAEAATLQDTVVFHIGNALPVVGGGCIQVNIIEALSKFPQDTRIN